MILISHILIALLSVAHSTYLFFNPSHRHLRISLSLVAFTLASGTYLVVSSGSPILKSCITGLFYLSVVSVGISSTWYKLAHEEVRHK